MTSPHTRLAARLLAAATVLLLQPLAWAAPPASVSAQSRYQQDRAACLAAGREPTAVRLLAVSKTFDAPLIVEAA